MPQEWHDEPLPRANRKPPARLLLMLSGLVCAILTTGTAASVYVAGDATRRATRKVGQIALMDSDAHQRGAAVHALIDTLIAPLGVLPAMDSSILARCRGIPRSPGISGHLDLRRHEPSAGDRYAGVSPGLGEARTASTVLGLSYQSLERRTRTAPHQEARCGETIRHAERGSCRFRTARRRRRNGDATCAGDDSRLAASHRSAARDRHGRGTLCADARREAARAIGAAGRRADGGRGGEAARH